MQMSIGQAIRLTLFGTSHGPEVGATVEGMPSGIIIDADAIQRAMDKRKPGGKYSSKRKESDNVEILSGVENGKTNGQPCKIRIANNDVKSSDYSFLPHHPRPGHQDLLMNIKTEGKADLRGGGTSSARLTAPIVAVAAILAPLIDNIGVKIEAHVSSIGNINAQDIQSCPDDWQSEDCINLRCKDPIAAKSMAKYLDTLRGELDSVGSKVELCISGLPLGLGEPWFDGIEPALARAMMAIPAARGVEFGRGFNAVQMRGSQHNDAWSGPVSKPKLKGKSPDGAIAGLASGAPLKVNIAFKPPSSIARPQLTLNLESGIEEDLVVKGRHDPVIGPRAVAVVEAMATFILTDLALRGGYFND
jgi:chorismate synthase